MFGGNPVKGTFDLTCASGQSAAGIGIVCAVNFLDVSVRVFLYAGTFDDVCAFQTDFAVRCETEEFLGGFSMKSSRSI